MERLKIAIACQGGGSHTAFSAGVLKKLLAEGIHQQYDLTGLSGTSGGGICAVTVWYGLLKTASGDARPPYQWLVDFWQDSSAMLPWEKSLNALIVQSIRLQDSGMLPSFAVNPYTSDWMLYWLKAVSPRKEYLDFRALIEKYINFNEISQLVNASSPRLLLGAVDLASGEFKAFDSKKEEIELETVMASASIPSFFKAITVSRDTYWDGLFSENPPITDLLEVELQQRPDEIWIIRVIPQTRANQPMTMADIQDRRNELSGNLALKQDVKLIELINQWIKLDGFVNTPQIQVKPIQVRWIEMSSNVSANLDYASKLNRDPSFIQMLMDDGEKQAKRFLKSLE